MRCDFSSVMQIIVKHTNLAQDKIVAGIFTDRVAHDLINSTIVSRWVSGEKPFSSTIAKHYLAEYKEADLSCEIEENIIPHIVDINIIQDEIYRLVENDVDISFAQKDKLLSDYPCKSDFDFANFIGAVLYYCIGRKHYTPTQLVKQEQHFPDTAELILDGEPPKACKYFCGRNS